MERILKQNLHKFWPPHLVMDVYLYSCLFPYSDALFLFLFQGNPSTCLLDPTLSLINYSNIPRNLFLSSRASPSTITHKNMLHHKKKMTYLFNPLLPLHWVHTLKLRSIVSIPHVIYQMNISFDEAEGCRSYLGLLQTLCSWFTSDGAQKIICATRIESELATCKSSFLPFVLSP